MSAQPQSSPAFSSAFSNVVNVEAFDDDDDELMTMVILIMLILSIITSEIPECITQKNRVASAMMAPSQNRDTKLK